MYLRSIGAALLMTLVVATSTRLDANPGNKESVTVSFGAGLNTAAPGNAANHHVIPQVIRLKAGGVVNFAVAGFHQIFVYAPGKDVADIALPGPPGPFINDMTGLYYGGLSPAGAAPAGFSNAQNRIESVSFSQPGTYLVICNVRGHFLDGMYAYVVVTG